MTGYAKSPSTFTPPLNSGSFIVSNTGVLPLADFAPVNFGNTYTNVKETCIVTAVLANGTTEPVISLGALSAEPGFTLEENKSARQAMGFD